MKALIKRGKYRGKIVEIGQWCNDWFTLRTGNPEIDRKLISPTSLAFDIDGINEITSHKNNGIMFNLYEIASRKQIDPQYYFIFKRRKRIWQDQKTAENVTNQRDLAAKNSKT